MILSRRACSSITEASSRNLVSRSQAASGIGVFRHRKVVQPVETRQVDRFFLLPGQRLPDLLGREGEDGRHERREGAADPAQGSLGRPALARGRRRGVEPVLQESSRTPRESWRKKSRAGGRRRGTRTLVGRDDRWTRPGLAEGPAIERLEQLGGAGRRSPDRSRRGWRSGSAPCSGSSGTPPRSGPGSPRRSGRRRGSRGSRPRAAGCPRRTSG